MKVFLASIALSLLSGSAFGRPSVKVSIDKEIKNIDQMTNTIKDYQERYWAIGLDGDTLMPDNIVSFFADRNLEFKYYVDTGSGVKLGDSSAYEYDLDVLQAYKSKIIKAEINDANTMKSKLKAYRKAVSSPSFTGPLPPVEELLTYYAALRLPVDFQSDSGEINVIADQAYEKNKKILDDYISRLKVIQKTVGAD